MDSIGSILNAANPPPTDVPDFGAADDGFDALLARFHEDLAELRAEAAARAEDRGRANADDRARGQDDRARGHEIREDAYRLRENELSGEDRAQIARALGRPGNDEAAARPDAGGERGGTTEIRQTADAAVAPPAIRRGPKRCRSPKELPYDPVLDRREPPRGRTRRRQPDRHRLGERRGRQSWPTLARALATRCAGWRRVAAESSWSPPMSRRRSPMPTRSSR